MAPPQDQTADTPGLDWLDTAITIATQGSQALTAWTALIPLSEFAIRKLFDIFRRENPQLTPEQFYAYLKTQGRDVKLFSTDWLIAHGYTLVDGEWQAPAAPAALASRATPATGSWQPLPSTT